MKTARMKPMTKLLYWTIQTLNVIFGLVYFIPFMVGHALVIGGTFVLSKFETAKVHLYNRDLERWNND
jgi:hypothetical protein